MVGFARSAGGFFTFHLFQYMAFLAMQVSFPEIDLKDSRVKVTDTSQSFFRMFGILCTNFDMAFRLATFFIPNMISYAGRSFHSNFFLKGH